MGSWWAYYELGWGGWWFWDPVENASFMPWLAATALLHSALVMEKREALKVWTILLAILAFSLSLMGTFLVRSGILTSVHAFAVDPRRGVFILAILIVLIGGALALYAWRAPRLKQGGLFAPISREGALVLNNVLLTTGCATVFIGTLYPLALEVAHRRQDLGRPALLQSHLRAADAAAAAGHAVRALSRLEARRPGRRGAAPVGGGARWRSLASSSPFARLLARAVAGAVRHRAGRLDRCRRGLRVGHAREAVRGRRATRSWRRARGLPRSAYGGTLAHAGIGLTRARHRRHLGLAERAASSPCEPGDSTEIAGYELAFRGVAPAQGPNYQEQVGLLAVTRGGAAVTELSPAKRLYDAPRQPTTEAGIHVALAGDLYVVLGDELKDGSGWVVRLYFNPLVRLIWLGAIVMALGGALSLSDRRLRIGAPRRARRARRPAPAE